MCCYTCRSLGEPMINLPISANGAIAQAQFERFYITSQQISEFVGVSRHSVFKAREQGKLPRSFSIGAVFLWEREFIMPYLESWKNTVQARSPVGAP